MYLVIETDDEGLSESFEDMTELLNNILAKFAEALLSGEVRE